MPPDYLQSIFHYMRRHTHKHVREDKHIFHPHLCFIRGTYWLSLRRGFVTPDVRCGFVSQIRTW